MTKGSNGETDLRTVMLKPSFAKIAAICLGLFSMTTTM